VTLTDEDLTILGPVMLIVDGVVIRGRGLRRETVRDLLEDDRARRGVIRPGRPTCPGRMGDGPLRAWRPVARRQLRRGVDLFVARTSRPPLLTTGIIEFR
jgi:hypothetical protein